MDLRGRWCFQVVWPSRASAERQEVEDYAFVKKFSKVEKPKAPQVPKAAEGIDLEKLRRWRRHRSACWHGAPDVRRSNEELRSPLRHGWRAVPEGHLIRAHEMVREDYEANRIK